MNVELNDKRYIYIVEEDNGETYDMYFVDITMITTDYDFAVSVLEKKRYKKTRREGVLMSRILNVLERRVSHVGLLSLTELQ